MSINKYLLLAVITSSVSFVATALPLEKEDGFAFVLSVQVGATSNTSQFINTDESNAKTDGTNNGESVTTPFVYPLMRLQYTTEDLNTQFYVGNSVEQVATANFQYELGLVHNFENVGKFTIAASPKLSIFNTTWEDPYAFNQTRVETKQQTSGVRTELINLFNSPFGIKYAYATNEVEDEKSGEGNNNITASDKALLVRDSQFHQFQLQMMLPVAQGIYLRPSLKYLLRDSEGQANSYDEYSAQLTMLAVQGAHSITVTLEGGVKKFSVENPIFNQKQDSMKLGAFAIYSYKQPFDWENTSVSLSAGTSNENSDIDFFDETKSIVAVGFVYKF